MKKVAAVILHFADKKLTANCLESVSRLVTGPGLIGAGHWSLVTFLVNNNPKENLGDLKSKFTSIKSGFKKFNFLETKKNLGFTGGNNFGIKAALKDGADYILMVNNDTVLDEDLVAALIGAGEMNSSAGILGPKIYFYPGKEFHKERYKKEEKGRVIWYAGGVIDWNNIYGSHQGVDEVDKGQFDELLETDFVSGCVMMVKAEVFGKIGFLDERYFLYLEDLEFCQRAKRAGFSVLYVPAGKLWHVNAASSSVGGDLQDYFLTRNRLLFGLTYAGGKTKLALFRESLKMLVNGRKWQKTGVKDFYLRRFGQGSWK